MDITDRRLKNWIKNPLTDKRQKDNLLEKTDFTVKDGMSEHHTTFFHVGVDGYYYYKTYFGKGWNKRKPNKEGWIKFLSSLAYNVHTGAISERSKIFQ